MSTNINDIANKHSTRLHRSQTVTDAMRQSMYNYNTEKKEPRVIAENAVERGKKRREIDALFDKKRTQQQNAEVWDEL